MKIEIDVSERTHQKIKILMSYTGMNIKQVEEVATRAVELGVTEVLCSSLQVTEEEIAPDGAPAQQEEDWDPHLEHEQAATYDGVGDPDSDEYEEHDDDFPEMPEAESKRTPRNEFGVTDEDLEHDEDVEDPEHEVVQQAPGTIRGIADDSEGLFAALSGMAVEEDPRAVRRRSKTLKSRAKITGMEG